MSELLTALVAAAKVGFEAPKCAECEGSGSSGRFVTKGRSGIDPDCYYCHATGLDASDPERLIGRAMLALAKDDDAPVKVTEYMVALTCSAWTFHHDGTPTGLATALLRLVARTGGAA